MTGETISQVSIDAKSCFKLARYIKEMLRAWFPSLAIKVEKKLKHWDRRERAELQQLTPETFLECESRADQDVELRVKRPDGKIFAPLPPIGFARGLSYYISTLFSKKNCLQNIAQCVVQNPAWAKIHREC